MDALKKAFTRKGAGRLYWCGYGSEISNEITNLIRIIRASGREAHYVTTDGFDKTIIHLAKSAFEDNDSLSQEIKNALDSSEMDGYFGVTVPPISVKWCHFERYCNYS
ncbi:hypothetical protein [Aquimarina sp. RZ0]|uniref:hypothetical protein n=1 Tax=Aquimarina sp. RZ0 TaxID=2607730 RepID=UPI00165EFC06|nr:hypothetical protein [Aquimarina sp. RZ0]